MTLPKLGYTAARTTEQACSLAKDTRAPARVMAGGTDLLGILKDRVHSEVPGVLVDLKTIPGLDEIRADRRALRIGALATLDRVAADPAVAARWPLVARAARDVASPQIRNVGTVAGNICQEPRCWYYRNPEDTFHCMRKGGTTCNALAGDNRYHSVFGAVRVGASPCSAGCPAGVDIPAYLEKVRAGDMDGAASILIEANPMPAITGRVCPHPCELECNRNEADEAVSVRAVERAVGDHVLERAADLMRPPARRTSKSVAVVGSGPAGLAAAYALRRAGHAVTIFDRMPKAGGMLAWGIPSYRLPKDVLQRQIAAFEAMGIELRLGVAVGEDVHLARIRKQFDAVFVATGAWRQRRLGMENEDLAGSGIGFLADVQRGLRKSPGRRVIVIGGGSVAVDVAITARRLGAGTVTMACLESTDEMPALPEDLTQALCEGIRILPSWGPSKVIVRGGRIAGMEFVRCTSVFDPRGRFAPAYDRTSTRVVKSDCVLFAIGQTADLSWLGKAMRTGKGRIEIDPETGATSLEGVFAGGDAAQSNATVIAAVASGMRAGRAIDAWLTGSKKGRAGARGGSSRSTLVAPNPAALSLKERARPPSPMAKLAVDVEDATGLDAGAVTREAHRCLNCGCVAVNASDLAPALVALDARIVTTERTVPAQDFFAAPARGTTVLDRGEIVTQIVVPDPGPQTVQVWQKFRIRNSIDFAIVSVACAMAMKGDRVARARIVLGAVAPVPVRARQVEAWLAGKRLDSETADVAATLAAAGARPLARNAYKVQIVKTLVRRGLASSRPARSAGRPRGKGPARKAKARG